MWNWHKNTEVLVKLPFGWRLVAICLGIWLLWGGRCWVGVWVAAALALWLFRSGLCGSCGGSGCHLQMGFASWWCIRELVLWKQTKKEVIKNALIRAKEALPPKSPVLPPYLLTVARYPLVLTPLAWYWQCVGNVFIVVCMGFQALFLRFGCCGWDSR